MATQQMDTELPEMTKQALIVMLESGLATLPSIKEGEFEWLERYTILIGAVISFLFFGTSVEIKPWFVTGLVFVCAVITGYFQYILMKERASYYRVLRYVVRAQNETGLFNARFLGPHFADSAFPKGLGPDKEHDGTAPYSSFLARQVYVFALFTALIAAAIFRKADPAFCGILVILDIICIFDIFQWDKESLYADTLAERHLRGADPSWFPNDRKQ